VRLPGIFCLLGFVALAACTPSPRDIQRIDIMDQLCIDTCRSFSISLSADEPSAFQAALDSLPVDAVVSCASRHDDIETNDYLTVTIALQNGRAYVCHETAAGPTHAHQHVPDDVKIRAFVDSVGWGIYLRTSASRRAAIERAIRTNTVQAVELTRSGCYGTCPVYDVTFLPTGSARIVYGIARCRIQARASIPFERVRDVLFETGAEWLQPSHPLLSVDTSGATIAIATAQGRFVSGGPDSSSWGPELQSLIDRLDQIIVDADWSPPLPQRFTTRTQTVQIAGCPRRPMTL
jgi:hypothetical protein